MNKAECLLEQLLSEEKIVTPILKRFIEDDIEKQEKNPIYSDTIIREIIMGAQEFEYHMRKFISVNKIEFEENLWKSMGGKLLSEIDNIKKFEPKQISILREIVELRNWVVHGIYEEEKEYNRKHANCSWVVDGKEWYQYYHKRLAITKHLIFEAIDFFTGASNVIS